MQDWTPGAPDATTIEQVARALFLDANPLADDEDWKGTPGAYGYYCGQARAALAALPAPPSLEVPEGLMLRGASGGVHWKWAGDWDWRPAETLAEAIETASAALWRTKGKDAIASTQEGN